MRRWLLSLLLPVAALSWATTARAQAVAAADNSVTLLRLGVVGSVRETPDLLTAALDGTVAAADPASAQKRLDGRMQDATRAAGGVAGVNWQIAGYAVERTQAEQNADKSLWTAHQTLQLQSADAGALLGLVGTLQGMGLTVDALQWVLSPAHQADAQQRAATQALKQLRERADAAAAALGLHVSAIRSVTLGDADRPHPQPMMRMMAVAPMPQATRGDAEVSESVEAEIALVR